jgi:hypothetical protein
MELLKKTITDTQNPRNDNSDKKELFPDGRRPRSAADHREDWLFIEDEALCENISYQMQYLEFQIHLYNDYQMYLTLESLHLKNIVSTISGIVEAALYALIRQGSEKTGYTFDERRSFLDLIDDAYDMKLIDRQLSDVFHRLRKDRNLVHFRDLEYREYNAYTVLEVNEYIEALDNFLQKSVWL